VGTNSQNGMKCNGTEQNRPVVQNRTVSEPEVLKILHRVEAQMQGCIAASCSATSNIGRCSVAKSLKH